ncbi:MAG: Gfo/Idh/MocA family oxidoreductase [Ignavibacteria bacterium]|nr:Gfo/Idh/MocA family oxidoreductase [Ignavibacteria bacterium]
MAFENIHAAVVGCGRWGMNHVKTAYSLLGPRLKYACDAFPSAEEKVKAVGDISFTTNLDDVLSDATINAVIIATPAETHYEVALRCLKAGKNVLVEKPITLVSEEAAELHTVAVQNNLKLMVGHVLLYHPAIIKIKEDLNSGRLGKLQYIYCNRLNLGTVRSEENILWSFAPHDISIIQYLTESNPESIEAFGARFLQRNIEDSTITYLNYPDNVHAHIFVSWLHPFKEQRLVVIGDKGMYSFEDTLKEGKLKFYPKGFTNVNGELQKFDGEFEVVQTEAKQPLTEEQMHFYNSILNNTKPLTDGLHALEVLKILEEAGKKTQR